MKTTKDIPKHSHPQEKWQELGPQALTDEELVAAILVVTRKGFFSFQEAGLIKD